MQNEERGQPKFQYSVSFSSLASPANGSSPSSEVLPMVVPQPHEMSNWLIFVTDKNYTANIVILKIVYFITFCLFRKQ